MLHCCTLRAARPACLPAKPCCLKLPAVPLRAVVLLDVAWLCKYTRQLTLEVGTLVLPCWKPGELRSPDLRSHLEAVLRAGVATRLLVKCFAFKAYGVAGQPPPSSQCLQAAAASSMAARATLEAVRLLQAGELEEAQGWQAVAATATAAAVQVAQPLQLSTLCWQQVN